MSEEMDAAGKSGKSVNKPESPKDVHLGWWIFWGFVLVLILAGAILAPYYWNYKLGIRNANLLASSVTNRTPVVTYSVQTNQVPACFADNDGVLHTNVLSVVRTNEVKIVVRIVPDNDVAIKLEDEIKAPQIFDGYARYLTLLLGLTSFLGLSFGFFMHKNLREVRKEVQDELDRQITLWRDEAGRSLTDVKERLKQTDDLYKFNENRILECKEVTAESRGVLERLNASAPAVFEESKASRELQKTQESVSTIDDDPSVPAEDALPQPMPGVAGLPAQPAHEEQTVPIPVSEREVPLAQQGE